MLVETSADFSILGISCSHHGVAHSSTMQTCHPSQIKNRTRRLYPLNLSFHLKAFAVKIYHFEWGYCHWRSFFKGSFWLSSIVSLKSRLIFWPTMTEKGGFRAVEKRRGNQDHTCLFLCPIQLPGNVIENVLRFISVEAGLFHQSCAHLKHYQQQTRVEKCHVSQYKCPVLQVVWCCSARPDNAWCDDRAIKPKNAPISRSNDFTGPCFVGHVRRTERPQRRWTRQQGIWVRIKAWWLPRCMLDNCGVFIRVAPKRIRRLSLLSNNRTWNRNDCFYSMQFDRSFVALILPFAALSHPFASSDALVCKPFGVPFVCFFNSSADGIFTFRQSSQSSSGVL